MTTMVVLVTSFLDGQVTFLSSALTSLRKFPNRLYQRILSFMAFSLSGLRGRALRPAAALSAKGTGR